MAVWNCPTPVLKLQIQSFKVSRSQTNSPLEIPDMPESQEMINQVSDDFCGHYIYFLPKYVSIFILISRNYVPIFYRLTCLLWLSLLCLSLPAVASACYCCSQWLTMLVLMLHLACYKWRGNTSCTLKWITDFPHDHVLVMSLSHLVTLSKFVHLH